MVSRLLGKLQGLLHPLFVGGQKQLPEIRLPVIRNNTMSYLALVTLFRLTSPRSGLDQIFQPV